MWTKSQASDNQGRGRLPCVSCSRCASPSDACSAGTPLDAGGVVRGTLPAVKDGFRVLDSDLHILEPPDLWERYIDAPFKHQAPRGLSEWVLDLRIEVDGKTMPAGVFSSPTPRNRSAARDRERFRSFHERGWDAAAQLDAMDEEGVDVGVLYPTRGLFAQAVDGMEPKLAAAIARAYNNWLAEFCTTDPSRLIGAGMISPFDIDDAIEEAERCVRELGFKGIFLRPNPVNGRN